MPEARTRDSNVVEDYGWRTGKPPQSFGVVTPQVLRLVKKLGVSRVLDLGAGNGALCSALRDAGYEAVGIEYDRKGYEVARASHPDIPFYNLGVQDDPKQLLSSEAPFDAVVSTEVIEHLFSPHLLPRFSREVLREEGYLIVSTPYHGYLKNLVLSILDKWDIHHSPLTHGGHIKFWSKKTLAQLLQENGFEVLEFVGVGRAPYLWKSFIVVARKSRR